MATVNLGVIKPVFKGAYNNSTAYVLDNIVTSGGSSYICILASTGNAVSNTTYWSTLAAGTGDASDLTSGTLPIARIANDAIDSIHYAAGSIDNEHLADDAVGVAELSATGTASSSTFLRGDNAWANAGKAVELHTLADDVVGSVADGANWFSWSFTPTITGKVFLAHTGAHRANGASHFYMMYYFNNGSGEVAQITRGAGYAISGTDHNQGWSASFFAIGGTGDSTTPITVTANTACTFRCELASSNSSNQANDNGRDHLVSAIVFET